MLKKELFLMALAIWGLACSNDPAASEMAEGETAEMHEAGDGHDHDHGDAPAEGDGKHFGETIDGEGAIQFAEVITQLESADSVGVKMVGTVESVCQVKGCWMELASNSEEQSPMRVRFKDYGFFMPKDIAGRKVVVDGYAFRSVTTVEELRHYAEDAGMSQEEIEQITEPEESIQFLASGVLLLEEEEG